MFNRNLAVAGLAVMDKKPPKPIYVLFQDLLITLLALRYKPPPRKHTLFQEQRWSCGLVRGTPQGTVFVFVFLLFTYNLNVPHTGSGPAARASGGSGSGGGNSGGPGSCGGGTPSMSWCSMRHMEVLKQAVLVRALYERSHTVLCSQGLWTPLMDIEMPLVRV